jgi:mycothiol synthase
VASAQLSQLQMLWPSWENPPAPPAGVPSGYRLRLFETADTAGYCRLLDTAGFKGWNEDTVKGCLLKVLPDGFFLVEHEATGELAATAMANHNPIDLHPYGGELGWVAASPAHARRGLGRAVCAAATRRFLEAGFHRIFLRTDDWRLPAIHIYLTLGYRPFLFAPDMTGRWEKICAALRHPFAPGQWPAP